MRPKEFTCPLKIGLFFIPKIINKSQNGGIDQKLNISINKKNTE